MDSGFYPLPRTAEVSRPQPVSPLPSMRQIVAKWLEIKRASLSKAGKMPQAEALLGYVNFEATHETRPLSLKLAFDGLRKLYQDGTLWTKTYLILDYMVKNNIPPEGLGRFMRRIMPVMSDNDSARTFEAPAILVKCLHAAQPRPLEPS
jgi:hypothetical protein